MIEFSQVGFRYGDDPADRPILDDVTLSLDPGGFYFLTGPSGAGKTTFLRLCYLALRPTAGTLTVFGRVAADVAAEEVALVRRKIGIVFQDGWFLDHLNVFDNVALPLRIAGKKRAIYRAHVAELIDWVGLSHRAHASPAELSGGERQRAALARAVIGGPDLIIADEPTGNVDREMGLRLLDLLLALNRHGKAVLIATHDLDLIRAAKGETDARVLRLADGRIERSGAAL